jgi:hypothetical protein
MIRGVRFAVIIAFLAAAPCGAQDLPDPGRRLSKEEQNADPEKRSAERRSGPYDAPVERPRDARACEGARRNYQIFCRAPNSHQSRSMDCAEAYALYRQNCG